MKQNLFGTINMTKKKIFIYAIALFCLVVLIWIGIAVYRIGDYKEKLWAHRVNSLEKREEFKDCYPNFEVDITIREDSLDGSVILDVTHDADISFGLAFDEFIPNLEKSEKVWLDIKNLSIDNNKKVLEKLDSFVLDFGLEKDQFIIETRDYKALGLLTKNNYYTSYYVDFKQIDEETIKHLEDVAQTGYVRALSFPSTQYSEIRSHVDNNDIDFLTWAHRETQIEFMLNPFNGKMLDDNRLKVILIKTRGKYHR